MNPETNRLQHFPVAWFATIMGLAGLTLAWTQAERVFALGFAISPFLLLLTTGLFALLSVVYGVKIVRYPQAVLGEFRHPVRLAFIPTFSIGLLLLAIALLGTLPRLSFWLWGLGTVLHLGFTLYVLSSWIHHTKYEIAHLNPAWFIPVVGNILVPIAGVHHAPADISWFFLSLGLFFWPVLTAIIFYRLIFHGSLPQRFMPTLFIFIAPPAVGFIAWHSLVGELDNFGRMLYFTGLFFTLLLLAQVNYFTRLKFFLSWWAYSFPLAAITIASLIMLRETSALPYAWIATLLLAMLSTLVLMLLVRTIQAVMRREICVEEG